MDEKKDIFKIGLVVIGVILMITFVSWMLMPAQKFVERQVMTNSQQYVESRKQEQKLLMAQIAEVENQIASIDDPFVIKNLRRQLSALNAQLKAAE